MFVTGTTYAQENGNTAPVITEFEVVPNSSINETNPGIISAMVTDDDLKIVSIGIFDTYNKVGTDSAILLMYHDISGISGLYSDKWWSGKSWYMSDGTNDTLVTRTIVTNCEMCYDKVAVDVMFKKNSSVDEQRAIAWIDYAGEITNISNAAVDSLLEIEPGISTARFGRLAVTVAGEGPKTVYSDAYVLDKIGSAFNPFMDERDVPQAKYQAAINAVDEAGNNGNAVEPIDIDTIQPVSQPPVVGIGAPDITMYSPNISPVTSELAEPVTFDVTINQTVNVSWLINGENVKSETNVDKSFYTSNSASIGNWAVNVIVENDNGVDQQKWDLIVTSSSPIPPQLNSGISGYALSDINDNGEQDASDIPLEGVTIRLVGISNKGEYGHIEIVKKEAITGSNGFYKFENLEPGKYFLIEEVKDGFVQSGHMMRNIELSEGQISENNNFLFTSGAIGSITTRSSTTESSTTESDQGIKESSDQSVAKEESSIAKRDTMDSENVIQDMRDRLDRMRHDYNSR